METLIPNNPYDDQEFDSNMNESGSEEGDDHDKIMHEKTLLIRGWMDLIREEAPTQIVNLILRQHY